MNERRLEAQGLVCRYGDRKVLHKLTLAAAAGEVLGLIGPNGAGKTTLLRALARLLRPHLGSVLLQGHDVWKMSPRDVARHTAISPQSEVRDLPLTVTEVVLLGRTPHRGWIAPFNDEDRRVASDAMERLELIELADRPVTQLSGGEWRRVVLARALAQQPRALLLDEPTSQLDLKHQVQILLHVRQLAVVDQRVVIVTLHDLQQAALCTHRLALLHRGKLAALGTPHEVLTSEIIGQVYGIEVTVVAHPVHGTPLVVPSRLQPPQV
jgi:iron complex transport system ATP-binding protein